MHANLLSPRFSLSQAPHAKMNPLCKICLEKSLIPLIFFSACPYAYTSCIKTQRLHITPNLGKKNPERAEIERAKSHQLKGPSTMPALLSACVGARACVATIKEPVHQQSDIRSRFRLGKLALIHTWDRGAMRLLESRVKFMVLCGSGKAPRETDR